MGLEMVEAQEGDRGSFRLDFLEWKQTGFAGRLAIV